MGAGWFNTGMPSMKIPIPLFPRDSLRRRGGERGESGERFLYIVFHMYVSSDEIRVDKHFLPCINDYDKKS